MKKALLFAALLLLVAPSAFGEDKVLVASEWAVLVGHSLDAAATQRCLGTGGCRELNPWLARYDSPVAFTAAKASITVVQLWAMRKLSKSGHPKLAAVTNFAIGAGFTALAIRNEKFR